MASAIDVCNTALARIGQVGNIASIDPPEGGAISEACSIFLPIAVQEMLESFPYSFACRRATVALLSEKPIGYRYAYRLPADCLRVLDLLKGEEQLDDEDYPYSTVICEGEYGFPLHGRGDTRWDVEAIDGVPSLLTYVKVDAVRYLSGKTNVGMFSATAADALAWLLASKLAGALLGGDAGAKMAQNCLQFYNATEQQAISLDLQRQNKVLFYRSPFVDSFIGGQNA